MADDIDIEEHDPMDNPRIADMFLANIKSEPVDYEDNYSEYSGVNYEENVSIKEEPKDYDPEHCPEESQQQTVPSHYENRVQNSSVKRKNLIILGSKPCPRSKKLKTLFISLEDWGDRLNTSPCYCKECMILFATRNALDAHKMSVHSFLVAVEEVKEEETPKPQHRFCNHCQTYFEDEALLIQHLYDLIQAKQAKIKEKPQPQPQLQPTKPSVSSEIVNPPIQKTNMYNVCRVCTCYFKKKLAYEKHCVLKHGAGVAFDRVCVPDNGYVKCKFCGAPAKTLLLHNRHIRICHNSIYVRKAANGVQKVKNTIPTKKLIASKVKNVYTKNVSSNMHLGKLYQRNLEKTAKSAKSNSLAVNTNEINNDYRLSFKRGVPKNILFKCDKCPKYFLNCLVALTHAYRPNYAHTTQTNVWKCPDCHRLFRQIDSELHQLQHRHTREFKVYDVHPNIYSRVLCRCAKCNIYFEERLYIKHTKLGCADTSFVDHCSICDLTVNNSIIHKQKHTTRQFIKSDFILIEDFVQHGQTQTSNASGAKIAKIPQLPNKKIAKPNLKRPNTEFPEPIPKKKPLISTTVAIKTQKAKRNEIPMYYCKLCQTYAKKPYKRSHHLEKKCQESIRRVLSPCPICGLTFCSNMQLKSHTTFMHTKHNVHFKDYKFVCIRSLKPCMPPLPKFRKCTRCAVQYLDVHSKCNLTAVKTCKMCKRSFTESAFRLHMLHHKYMTQTQAPHKNMTHAQAPGKSIENTLKMKYRMLKPTWNILYNCKACDVTTDSYDNVVGHCQKHYNHMESYGVTIMNCEVCNLNFENKCYKRHVELHENETIDRDSFTILTYDYFELLRNNWFKIFTSIPGEQVTQILRRSIYVTRIVKMTMLQNGPPEYTVYKCQTCNKIVANDDICVHVESNDCDAEQTHKCSDCGLDFATERARVSHSAIHRKQAVNANSFRIVAFNHPGEAEFNVKLRSEYAVNSSNDTKTTVVNRTAKAVPKSKAVLKTTATAVPSNDKVKILKYKYYQCQKCYCCSTKRPAIYNHACVREENMRLCHQCNYVFHIMGQPLHLKKHLSTPMTRDNIVIEPINFPTKPDEWRVKLSECKKCQVKFPSHLIESHNCIKSGAIPAMKLYRCSGCKMLFSDKENLAKHEEECDLHEDKQCRCGLNHKEHIYKCNHCDVFMMSKAAAESHNRRDHVELPTEPCSKCGWNFASRALRKHISTHHLQLKLSPKDFCIIPIENENEQSAGRCSANKQQREIKAEMLKQKLENCDNGDVQDAIDKVDDKDDDKDTNVETASANEFRKLYSFSEFHRKYKNYKNALYRCAKCDVCYLNTKCWFYHEHLTPKNALNVRECTTCNARFTRVTMKKHLFNHEADPSVVYRVVTPEETPTRLLGPPLNSVSIKASVKDEEVATTSKVKESVVSQSVPEINQASPEPDQTTKQPESIKQAPKLDQTSLPERNTSTPPKKYTHKVYKCGECNVYFMAQQTCYTHMLHHTPIDSKEFIECKLCGLPFKIMALNPHMKKHHKEDFNLDEVLVEEYTKDSVNRTPKIEIYYAIDKVQSRLVSTTSDEANCDADSASNNQPSSSTNTVEDAVDTVQNEASDEVMEAQSSFTEDEKINNEFPNVEEDRSLDDSIRPEDNIAREKHKCRFCDEVFKTNTSKEFHESLDHLDAEKSCEICKSSFNASILDALHLNIKDDTFQCCLCKERFEVQQMTTHSKMHV
ncbi:hypothetical protein evm_012336 [Chilo suppressalis]|nr:hypothetical protein evm_012336 [Chilo suppressalis]